jgi:two-component system chemotaxis response regulator CheY
LSAWHRFSGKLGDIFVRLDATFAPGFELGDTCAAQSPPIAEGEMVCSRVEDDMSAKVMVVDDSLMVRQQVRAALTSAGFSVTEAQDGKEALDKLSQAPDTALVVLDVNMPNMNGMEFLESMRKRQELASVRVVMLTTEGQPRLMQQAKALGAKGWIIKPFKTDFLVAAVQKLTAS